MKWLAISLLVLCACATRPNEACRDLVDAYGESAARCGEDRASYEAVFESGVTMDMGCRQTDQIRDLDDFYDVCVPYFETLSCTALDTLEGLPDECLDQLLFRL